MIEDSIEQQCWGRHKVSTREHKAWAESVCIEKVEEPLCDARVAMAFPLPFAGSEGMSPCMVTCDRVRTTKK